MEGLQCSALLRMDHHHVVVAASASLALLFFLCITVVTKAFYSLWWKPKWLEKQLRQQGVRGNPYRLLYGDMEEEKQAMKDAWSRPMDQLNHKIVPRAAPFAYNMAAKYGKLCLHWEGTTPRIVIWDPDMVKEFMSDKSGEVRKPKVSPLVEIISKGLSSLEGQEWAQRRRRMNPAFHLQKLKGMVPAFATSCIRLVERWEELVGGVEGSSCELDVWPEFQNLTGDVISKTAFGSSFEEGQRIFQLQKEQAQLVMEALLVPYIPGSRFIPTAKNKRRMMVDREINSMLRAMIDKKLKSAAVLETTEGSDSGDNDLLGMLLQVATENKREITMEDVIEECKLFYFAGQETTSTWLTWTLVLLSMHPIWQQRAREEVLRTCGDQENPDFESIGKLKTVTMILYEVLRLYPSVVSLPRHVYKETKLGDLTIPAGVNLMLPIIHIHHDPEYWGEDAEEFNPERFSEGVSKASRKNAFFPFGWGPRICLGQNFAMIEAKMALAMILQRFSFELSPSYAHAPYIVITLQPQHGAHLILRRRL